MHREEHLEVACQEAAAEEEGEPRRRSSSSRLNKYLPGVKNSCQILARDTKSNHCYNGPRGEVLRRFLPTLPL